MSLGIECLLTDDEARAANCAQELDRLNRERRKIEAAMLEQALDEVKKLAEEDRSTFFVPDWHEGVVGILASRLKDRLHRPVVCFARSDRKSTRLNSSHGYISYAVFCLKKKKKKKRERLTTIHSWRLKRLSIGE